MYTVVIVDDEPWALQGLAEIIDWNNEGFSIIGQFTDPDEAFEFLCKKEPDVVFTDIRMPGLSGLDLIEMSRVKGLNCEFVLISSYEDFEAAQKGIRLHVWEYILKPYANDKPGFGIDIDEKKAAMYPCSYREPGWLLARTTDGTAVRP